MTRDEDAFSTTLAKIDNGWIFEDFSQKFLSARLGKTFIPVGGTGDKGVDGFTSVFSRDHNKKDIYQMSTEISDPLKKIEDTIKKLKSNGILFDRLTYVTNRFINGKDDIIEVLYEQGYQILIWDNNWFKSNLNYSGGTEKVYIELIKDNYHDTTKPGRTYTIQNLDKDPRLYVFLAQQFETSNTREIDDLLIDTLILFFLEDTDPDEQKLRSEQTLVKLISRYLEKDEAYLKDTISNRLANLIKSEDKRIQFHSKQNGYCLPYDTRIQIQERNTRDSDLHDQFINQISGKVRNYLKGIEVKVQNIPGLVEQILQNIFYQQGLEFSNFLLKGGDEGAIEKELDSIIDKTLEESSVVPKNRYKVKDCLTYIIRDLVYNGTPDQKYFLRSLSNTYMLMFLLKWDPKISTFFSTLSNRLTIYVGNSIIIPAFSEVLLENSNRRHWNLLKSAKAAGITMIVTDYIIDELVSHFFMIRDKYYKQYHDHREIYSDEDNLRFVDEILLRAYFYSRNREKTKTFKDFISLFVDPNLQTLKNDLIEMLREAFGIEYMSKEKLNIDIDNDKYELLYNKLKDIKSNPQKAEYDARLILTVYKIREINNESDQTGIFGYNTWWLSKDTATYKIVKEVLSDSYQVSCYIRTDFLYNYIMLSPTIEDVELKFKELFPSLLGVNISYHMSPEVLATIHETLKQHKDLPMHRRKSVIRKLSERLKSDVSFHNSEAIQSFFDGEFLN